MDIDLKNINISDIKDQITKLADKSLLMKLERNQLSQILDLRRLRNVSRTKIKK